MLPEFPLVTWCLSITAVSCSTPLCLTVSRSLPCYKSVMSTFESLSLSLSLFLAELKLSDRESDSVTFSLAVRQKCRGTAPLTSNHTWTELWSPAQGAKNGVSD